MNFSNLFENKDRYPKKKTRLKFKVGHLIPRFPTLSACMIVWNEAKLLKNFPVINICNVLPYLSDP